MMEKKKLVKYLLLLAMYLVVAYILFLSVTTRNYGEENFDKCIANECELYGEEWCNKYRTINNCCLGANGRMAMTAEGYSCVFGG